MTPQYEAQIIAHIAEFESTRRESPAFYAAGELAREDPFAPAKTSAELRIESRERRVELWGRLFRAIDALRDPKFSPEKEPPHVGVTIAEEDMPDPEAYPMVTLDLLPPDVQRKYRERLKVLEQQAAWDREQFGYYRIHLEVSALAEEYFKSAFVRSRKSVALIERIAESGHWTATRRQQVVSWVAP